MQIGGEDPNVTKFRIFSWIGLGMAAVFALTPAAMAQSKDPQVADLLKRINELERKVNELEGVKQKTDNLDQQTKALDQQVRVIDRRQELQQEEQHEFVSKLPVVEAGQDGFWLRSPDKKSYSLHIGGYFQGDGRFYTSQAPTTGAASTNPSAASTFLLRRARPYFEGTVAKYFDYKFMLDFGQGQSTLQDAYGDIHYIDEARLRFGKFKEPVGLERLQDDRYLTFVERGYPTELVPDRDLGLQFWGQLFEKQIEYQAGVFNGTPDNVANVDSDNNNPKDFAGRIFVHPFNASFGEYVKGLGLGVAGTYGNERGNTIDTYKSEFQNQVFAYNTGTVASGNRYRIAPQFNYYWNSLGLFGEFVQNRQSLSGPFGPGKKSVGAPISNYAWQIYTSYVLTGEEATYTGVKPRHDFDFSGNSWGAWEIAARLEDLEIDRDAFKLGLANPNYNVREAFTWVVGVNWYLNRNVKLMTDYAYTQFSGGAPKGSDRHAESGFLNELQLQW